MSDNSGLNLLQRLLGFEPAAPITPIEGVSIISGGTEDDYGQSTLKKSQKDQDQENSMNATIPWLPPMLMANEIVYSLDVLKNNIIEFMLKKWSESNADVEEAARKKIMQEITSGVDRLFQSNVIPGINTPLSANDASKLAIQGTSNDETAQIHGDHTGKMAGLGILIMMLSGAAMLGTPGAAIGVGQPGLSVVGEMITTVIIPTGVINNDVKGELHQLAGLMLIPLFYPAMAQALAAAKSGGEKLDLAFAKANLYQVILLVTDRNFDLFLKSLISTNMPNIQNQDQQNKLLQTAKLMMLYAALATYYEVETGWTSGQEIGDMVNGKMHLEDPHDPRFGVIKLIQQEFQNMGLTGEFAEKLNQKFASYLGDKNSMTEFISPSRLFEEMAADLNPERIRNSAQ